MKKFFKSLLVIALFMFCINTNVYAAVSSTEEISYEVNKIMELNDIDFSQFYNSSEVVGMNRSSFNIVVSEYKLKNKTIVDSLQSIISMIDKIQQSDEFTDSEKDSKTNELMQKANEELNKMGSNAMSFVSSVGYYLPTITYGKFKKAFAECYNSLYINEIEINL